MRSAVVNILNTILHDMNNHRSGSSVSLSSIRELNPYLLIDAFQVKYIPIIGLTHQQAIIKGDEKSTTIAAASIIAKVYRDDLMCQLAKDFPDYRWQENAGYGTEKHIESIKKHGVTKLHRIKFVDGLMEK